MKQRRQGVDVPSALQGFTEKRIGELEERVNEIAEVLIPKIEESKIQIASLTEHVIKGLADDEITLAHSQKKEQLAFFKVIMKELEGTLPELRQNLEAEKREKIELQQMLAEFRKALKNSSGLKCQGTLYQIAESASNKIGTGKCVPVDNRAGKEKFVNATYHEPASSRSDFESHLPFAKNP
jgi:hypothetical protein